MALGSGSAALLILAVGSLLVASAVAATYRIPWNLQTNYRATYGSTPFASGDTLVFTFDSSHSLLEVSAADASSCNTGNPIQSYSSGAPITLTKDTSFICGTPGHCQQGMVLNVKLTSSTPAVPTTPATPSPSTGTPSSPPSTPSTPDTPGTPADKSPGSGAAALQTTAAILVASAALICPLLL